VPEAVEARADLRLLWAADGGDAIAAGWESKRKLLLEDASSRPFVPISATRAAARSAAPPVAGVGMGEGGRDFGSLVHRLLEWIPLDAAERAMAMAVALAPSFGIDPPGARRAGEAVSRALALPVMDRARRSPHVYREVPLAFADASDLIEGVLDLVFEEDGQLVIVDYKTDQILPQQALEQAHHHAPQLQLYGRGLAQATGQGIKERLVLFTTLGEVVPV
jgi:ATP-dependent exoDNAse (exonuclease V) beta subunit